MSRLGNVIDQWDVSRFLRRQGLEIRPTETGEVHVKCPRCHDSKYRLYVNKRTKNWICFNCSGKGRSAITFVEWVLNCDDARAVQVIVETANPLNLGRQDDEEEDQPRKKKTTTTIELPQKGYSPLTLPATARSQPYWDYLIGRNITPTMVRHYGMGYCRKGAYFYTDDDGNRRAFKVNNRIVVPIQIFGEQRGWVGRTILTGETKRKYLNPPKVHTSRLLFNLDTVIESGSETVVLMEGMFDVLRMPTTAVCTFGKKISNQQRSMLIEAGFRKWIFCYDGDALEDAAHHGSMTPSYVQCYRAKLPPQYDPGNAPLTILSHAIRDAEPWYPWSVEV